MARPGFFTGVMGLPPELQACRFDHGFLFVGRVGVRLSRGGECASLKWPHLEPE